MSKVYTKGELASLYLPNVSIDTARKKLRVWIKNCRDLEQKLTEIGYSPCAKLLTPAQVELIMEYLGEP
ncbi:DUF4248 domain-containing protein [Bacteroides sp. 224]|uniref:DUF4248 domain-containing protein n=1 Tax=Bacteroides sp. 224 TaxID=2302936 RepID=UPI0013D7552C|nr:DUF4248 domain-containing protein [Bacteroides sp. 224]NDV65044.1 DUF4248 domain-containing protein [Bacteroides sp. 224]